MAIRKTISCLCLLLSISLGAQTVPKEILKELAEVNTSSPTLVFSEEDEVELILLSLLDLSKDYSEPDMWMRQAQKHTSFVDGTYQGKAFHAIIQRSLHTSLGSTYQLATLLFIHFSECDESYEIRYYRGKEGNPPLLFWKNALNESTYHWRPVMQDPQDFSVELQVRNAELLLYLGAGWENPQLSVYNLNGIKTMHSSPHSESNPRFTLPFHEIAEGIQILYLEEKDKVYREKVMLRP